MRKIIKPGKTCERCGTQLTNDVYEDFCDICKEKIPNQDEQYPLRASVFHEGFGDTTDYEFCSWNCFFDFLTNFPLNNQRRKTKNEFKVRQKTTALLQFAVS